MATTKDIDIDDLLTGASWDSGNSQFLVPLSALSGEGGLAVGEVTDGRKVAFAIVHTMAKALAQIATDFDAIDNAATVYTSGIEVSQNDYVKHNNVIYQKTTSGTHTLGVSPDQDLVSGGGNYTEQNLTQEPDNFKIAINNARYSAGNFGSAEITQTFTVSAVYQGTTDLKPE